MMVVNTNILASCSVKDEGRPLDIALQERVSNYFRVLQSKAVALSVEEKDVQKGQVIIMESSESKPRKTRRNMAFSIVKTGQVLGQQSRRENLSLGHAGTQRC